MQPGPRLPPAERPCPTRCLMMTGTSGARVRPACQRVKNRDTGPLAQREARRVAADAAR